MLSERLLRSLVLWLAIRAALMGTMAVLTLSAARWIDPPTTAVHMEHRRRPGHMNHYSGLILERMRQTGW